MIRISTHTASERQPEHKKEIASGSYIIYSEGNDACRQTYKIVVRVVGFGERQRTGLGVEWDFPNNFIYILAPPTDSQILIYHRNND